MFPKPTSLRLKGKKLQQLRMAVWERDEGRCVHCDKPVMFSSDNLLRKMDLSHIVRRPRP